jgi:hypothetical protein
LKNSNNNCLEGMGCPNCGSEGPFKIEAVSTFTVSDDGTEDHGDVEWDDESFCQCEDCDHKGTVADFTLEQEE